jgi:hypothetical protein
MRRVAIRLTNNAILPQRLNTYSTTNTAVVLIGAAPFSPQKNHEFGENDLISQRSSYKHWFL